MPGITLTGDSTEVPAWSVTCQYDKEKEPASFMECMALFMLEQEQGWDKDFRPVFEDAGGRGNVI